MNGSDEDSNLVLLTAEEHYVAHQLLVKIYPQNNKLIYAVNMMSITRSNNKTYGWLRRKHSETCKKRKYSEKTKHKMSEFGKRRAPITEKTREKLRKASTGRKHTKDKISKAKKGNKTF